MLLYESTHNTNQDEKQEIAYKYIKDAIIKNVFKPDDQLTESELSIELGGMSRTPIRDAIRRLLHEGLLTSNPGGKGIFVTRVTFEDLIEIMEARALIECGTARMFAERATKEMVANLEDILNQINIAFDQEDYVKADELDIEFHYHIAKGSLNSQLFPVVVRLIEAYTRGAYLTMHDKNHIARCTVQHQQIFQAIQQRDSEQASAIMSTHLTDCVTHLIEVKKNNTFLFYR